MRWQLSRYTMLVPLDSQRGVLYNTLTRHLLLVNGELSSTLMRLLNPGQEHRNVNIEKAATADELQLLKDLHFLVQPDQDEKLFARYLIDWAKYNASMVSLFISFTSRCNFNCSYCYQDFRMANSQRDLSLGKWRILFTFIRNRVEEFRVSSLSVALFGGEPLLNLEVVDKACEDLKTLEKEGCHVSLTLITNGSLLTPPVWKSLAPYVELVQITLDGTEEIHNKHRPFADGRGSFDVIMANIAALAREIHNKVALRVNVQPETLEGAHDLVQLMGKSGLRHVVKAVDFEEVYPSQRKVCEGTCSIAKVSRLGSRLVELFLEAATLGLPLPKMFVHAPCIHSLSNSFAIDENLLVYKCPGFLYWQPVGAVRKDSRLELSPGWYEAVAYEPPCALDCRYGPICYGGCRALAGGLGRVHCRKPYFDEVFADLVRAYVLANHAQGLQE